MKYTGILCKIVFAFHEEKIHIYGMWYAMTYTCACLFPSNWQGVYAFILINNTILFFPMSEQIVEGKLSISTCLPSALLTMESTLLLRS